MRLVCRIAEMGAKNSKILEKTEIFVNAAAGNDHSMHLSCTFSLVNWLNLVQTS